MTYPHSKSRWYRTTVQNLIEEDVEWESRRPDTCA